MLIKQRIGVLNAKAASDRLIVVRRRIEKALRALPVLVALDQRHAGLARVADAADQIHADGFAGIERESAANRGHRVEHRTGAARQRGVAVHRLRIGRAAAATDETQTVRLVRDSAVGGLMRRQQVKHPWRRLSRRTRPAMAQDRLVFAHDLGFDK